MYELAELPVTMSGLRPLVPAKINGVDALFLADSGAFYSVISEAGAKQYQLRLHRTDGVRLDGLGGSVEASIAKVEQLTLARHVIRHVNFLVGGTDVGSGAVGVLGQNVLGVADAEYDLAKGVIRLMRPGEGCGKAAVLAYWAGSRPYSEIDIDWPRTSLTTKTSGSAYLNGTRIKVFFDTGASSSFVARRVAERAGFSPGGAGVVPGGFSQGLGPRPFRTWVAFFDSFKLGGEEIHNAQLRVGDADLPDGDMLLGADFFLSHHVYVANSQDKLYFTYNGGPVFDLRRLSSDADGTDGSPGALSRDAADTVEPADAAGFGRRGGGGGGGAAYAARQDFEHAIADLTRAAELDPNEASYLRQRGLVRLSKGQPDLALADMDQALKLKPDDIGALMARARLHLAGHDITAAGADLDAADRLSPKQANARLEIAEAYAHADMLAAALAQYDLWIAAHPEDAGQARAKNGRCWVRALLGSDLDKALKDCDEALGTANAAETLDSRGLVLLRLGKYDRSIADYDAALRLQPRNAWSLYGRGVDRLRKGMTAEGQSDIADAVAIRPNIAGEAARHGITP